MNPLNLCTFCDLVGGVELYRNSLYRIVLTDEPMIGFCRLIWNRHVAEWSDLDYPAQIAAMRGITATETLLRALLSPDKMNLASFGNVVPHLHWHIIPRFRDDRFFPDSVWGREKREPASRALPPRFVEAMRAGLQEKLKDNKDIT